MSELTYAFLDYELDVSAQTLTHCGNSVSLRPKTLATLAYLLANRHRAVTKEDLLDAVWPDVAVQDQAVFQSISELRSIFKNAHCIETVRGRGYRWVAPLDTGTRKPPKRSFRRASAVAAALVAAVVSVAWWHFADRAAPLTVVVNPATSATLPPESADVASSLDNMLVQQLRRMGWDARRPRDGMQPIGALELDIDIVPSEEGLALDFALHGAMIEESGNIASATPLGAVRDLATELHALLSSSSISGPHAPSINRLFKEAKRHLDSEDYPLAEAYLTVVVAEQPDYLSAKTALAYTYRQMGRHREAIDIAYAVYDAADRTNTRADRMMSALLLSQILATNGQYGESERFAHEASDIASAINDLLIVAEAQEQLGEISLATGQPGAGKEQLTVARQYYSTFCPTSESRVSRRLLELESQFQPDAAGALPSADPADAG